MVTNFKVHTNCLTVHVHFRNVKWINADKNRTLKI